MSIRKYEYNKVTPSIRDHIINLIKKECSHYTIDTSKILVVFFELYNNAYKCSAELPNISLAFLKHSIIMRMDDYGDGFDFQKHLNPSKKEIRENQLRESGRGILIVQKLVDDIVYNAKGNSVLVRIQE